MPRTTDARAKALATAERLFRTHGYAATGLSRILEESGAPKGSFYFHFPGGKAQLAREVLEQYGDRVAAGISQLAQTSASPAEFVRGLCLGTAQEMAAAGFSLGCAAQTLALELAPGDVEMREALSRVFQTWIGGIAQGLGGAPAARQDAEALLAALEGARTLARVSRSTASFEAVMQTFTARPGV